MNSKGWLPWPRRSTRAFMREARRTPGYSFIDWLHGYVYARWPYLYIGVGMGRHPLARTLRPLAALIGGRLAHAARDRGGAGFADTYHGKVVPLEAATQLVTVRQAVHLTNLEHIVPYALARDIILQHPDRLAVLECPCRAVRPNPCLPLDVCLVVGEPFASFVVEHHPRRARRIAAEEAVAILRAEDERGHAHHAFFKDAMLGRFYAICNCCSCCCGAIQAHRQGTPMLAPSGYTSRVDAERCLGCGRCADACQFGALRVDGGLASVDPIACLGCGVCVSRCQEGALSLQRDPHKGEPLELERLLINAACQTP